MTSENTQPLSDGIVESRETERGASLVEYALLAALISVVCIIAMNKLGISISNQFMAVDKIMSGS
jgi:Flp pilus assembly pilin Flp